MANSRLNLVISKYNEDLNKYENKKAHALNVERVQELMSTAQSILDNDGKPSVAVKLIHKAVQINDSLFHNNDSPQFDACIHMLNNKAVLCMKIDNDARGLFFLREAEKMIRQRSAYSNHQRVSDVYNNLALISKRNGLLELAREYLSKAQAINFKHKLPSGFTDMNMGTVMSALQRHFEALDLFKKSMAALEKDLYSPAQPIHKKVETMQLYLLALYHRGLEETVLEHYDDSLKSLHVFSVLSEHGLGQDDPFNQKAQLMASEAIEKTSTLKKAKLRLSLGYQEPRLAKQTQPLDALVTEDKLRQFSHLIPVEHKYQKPEETVKEMELPSTERKDLLVQGLRQMHVRLLDQLRLLCDFYLEQVTKAEQGQKKAKKELREFRLSESLLSTVGTHVVLNNELFPLFKEVLKEKSVPGSVLSRFVCVKVVKLQAWTRQIITKLLIRRFKRPIKLRLVIGAKRFTTKTGSLVETSQSHFMYSASLNIPEQVYKGNHSKPPTISYKVWLVEKHMRMPDNKWITKLPVTEILYKSKTDHLIEYWRYQARLISLQYLGSLIFIDSTLAFDDSQKLAQIYNNTLRLAEIDMDDIDSSEDSEQDKVSELSKRRQSMLFKPAEPTVTPIFRSNPPAKTPAARNAKPLGVSPWESASAGNPSKMGKALRSFEGLVRKSTLTIQRWVRGHLTRKKFKALWSVSSVPKLSKEFIQEGESFYLVVMKRLYSKELAFYCWNMTTQEIYEPLLVSGAYYDPLKPDSYIDRLFVCIDESRLYFRDFWDTKNVDRRDYLENFREFEAAERRMHLNTKDSRYRKRYFLENHEMRLVGKSTREIGGACYLQLTYVKYATGTCKITLFSKRTNDFVYVKYFYRECQTVQELIDFAREKFLDCTIKAHSMQGVENIFVDFPKSEEAYDTESLEKIRKIQTKFKNRKLVMDFDYFVGGNKFILHVFWLKCKRVLLFKVLVEADVRMATGAGNSKVMNVGMSKWRIARAQISKFSHAGDVTVIEQFTDGMGSMRSVRLEEGSQGSTKQMGDAVHTLGGFLAAPPKETKEKGLEFTKQLIKFQSLKINLEELVPSGSTLESIEATITQEAQKIRTIAEFIIRKKISYDNYFFFRFFEKDEIAELLFPPKARLGGYLFEHRHLDSMNSPKDQLKRIEADAGEDDPLQQAVDSLAGQDMLEKFDLLFQSELEVEAAFISKCTGSTMDFAVDSLQFDFNTAGTDDATRLVAGMYSRDVHPGPRSYTGPTRQQEESQFSRQSGLGRSGRQRGPVTGGSIPEGSRADGGADEGSHKKPFFDIESKYEGESLDSLKDKENIDSEASNKLNTKDQLSSYRQPKPIMKDSHSKTTGREKTKVKFGMAPEKPEGSDPKSQSDFRSKQPTIISQTGLSKINKLASKESHEVSKELSLNNLDEDRPEAQNLTHGSSKVISMYKPGGLTRQTSGHIGVRSKILIGSSRRLIPGGSKRTVSIPTKPVVGQNSVGAVRIRSTSKIRDTSMRMNSQKHIVPNDPEGKTSFEFLPTGTVIPTDVKHEKVRLPFSLENETPKHVPNPNIVDSDFVEWRGIEKDAKVPGVTVTEGNGLMVSPNPRQEMSVEYQGSVRDLPITPARAKTNPLELADESFFNQELFKKQEKELQGIPELTSRSNMNDSAEKRQSKPEGLAESGVGRSPDGGQFMIGRRKLSSFELSESPHAALHPDSSKLISLVVPPSPVMKIKRVPESPMTPMSLQPESLDSRGSKQKRPPPLKMGVFQEKDVSASASGRGLESSSDQTSSDRVKAHVGADSAQHPKSIFHPRRKSELIPIQRGAPKIPVEAAPDSQRMQMANTSLHQKVEQHSVGSRGYLELRDQPELAQSPNFPEHKMIQSWGRSSSSNTQTAGKQGFQFSRPAAPDTGGTLEPSFGERRVPDARSLLKESDRAISVNRQDAVRKDLRKLDPPREKSKKVTTNLPMVLTSPVNKRSALAVEELLPDDSHMTSMSVIPGYKENSKIKSITEEMHMLHTGTEALKRDMSFSISDFGGSRLERYLKH